MAAPSPTTPRAAGSGRVLPRPSARPRSSLVAKANEFKGMSEMEEEVRELQARHTESMREVNEKLYAENIRLKRDLEAVRARQSQVEEDAAARLAQLDNQRRVGIEKIVELKHRNEALETENTRLGEGVDHLRGQLADQERRLASIRAEQATRDPGPAAAPPNPAVLALQRAVDDARAAQQAEAKRAAQLEALCRDLTAQRTTADRARDDAMREVVLLQKRVDDLGRSAPARSSLFPEPPAPPMPPPAGADPEEHLEQLVAMQQEKNALMDQLKRATALAATVQKENQGNTQAREDLLALLQTAHPLAMNMQLRNLRQRYNVNGGLLLDLEDPGEPDAMASSSPWERLKWDVQQITKRFQRLDDDRNSRILILQQLVAKTPAPSLDARRELASAVLALAGPGRGSNSLAAAVDQMIALESEMQRLKRDRARAEENLARLVQEHGSAIAMDPKDNRAVPTPGYALLTMRLGNAEQQVRLLYAENSRLRSQLTDLSALIRA